MVCPPKVQIIFGLSSVFFVSGLLLVFLWEGYFNSYIDEQMTLTPGTYQYKYWLDAPVDINLEIFLFNWTNSDGFKKGEKPHFQQVGPYVYTERHKRANVVFNSNKTVSFNMVRDWKYVPERSNGSLDDLITIMNPIILAMGNIARNEHYLIKRVMHYFLSENNKEIAVTDTSGQFLFNGIDDTLMDVAQRLDLKNFKIPFDKFGWFYSRNGSVFYDGNFTMWTGTDDIQKTGIMSEWNGNSLSTAFEGECGRLNGSTGEVWFPTKNSETISIFVSDVCSLLTLEKQGSRISKGITGTVYAASDKLLDNGTKYPETKCFSPNEVFPSGVRDISNCKFKAPAFFSLPHFYLADPSYRDAIEGMNPDPQIHNFEMLMEPTHGLPIEAHITIQVNFMLRKIKEISLFENVNDTMVPYFWARMVITMPDNLAFLIKIVLIGGIIGQWMGYALISISMILYALGIYLELKRRNISVCGQFLQKSKFVLENSK